MLCRRVARILRSTSDAGDRARVDNAATVAQHAQLCLHAVHHAGHVDRKEEVPLIGILLRERRLVNRFRDHARDVGRAVEASEV